MRTDFFLAFLCVLYVPGAVSGQILRKQLAISQVFSETVNHQDTKRMIRVAVLNAVEACNCVGLSIRLDTKYQTDTQEEAVEVQKELESIIFSNFIQHYETSPDSERANVLKEKIRTDYLVILHITKDVSSQEREYRLEFSVIDLMTWNYEVTPIVYYLTATTLTDVELLKKAVYEKACLKIKERKMCEDILTVKRTDTLNPDPFNDIEVNREIKLEEFNRKIRQLIRTEYYLPDVQEIKKIRQQYTDTPAGQEHYLQQKLLVYNEFFDDYLNEGINPRSSFHMQHIADEIVKTIDSLMPFMNPNDPEQPSGYLMEMRRFYNQYRP